MFNLGFGELVLICIVLIVVVGPKKLPTLMKTVGKTMRTVRQASRDIQTSVGLDEILREDVMHPLLPPTPPPTASISRDAPLTTTPAASTVGGEPDTRAPEPTARAAAAPSREGVQPVVVPEANESPALPSTQTKVAGGPAGQDR